MVDRKDVASWLEGPGRPRPGTDQPYVGARLGLPESGPGSIAPFGRRLAALTVDWVACLLIARVLWSSPWGPLAVFAAESVLLIPTLGATFGMQLLGLRVAALGTARLVTPLRALVRTVLLCLAIPAVVWNRDGRGLHDRAADTVVVRAR